MNVQNKPLILRDVSFESILDNTCTRLQDKQTRYSIRRLEEMDMILARMEQELDIFVCLASEKQAY